jgi:fructokinase
MTLPLVAAVELGGTKINLAVGTGPSDLRAEVVIPTTDPISTIRAAIDFLRAQEGMTAVGIASFGPVCLDRAAPEWGHITATTKPGWSDTPVATAIADALGVPAAFDTDVNGAALGEHRWGALQGCGVGLYLTVGTGVGGGVVIDGVPLHGRIHPEMGHIRLKRAKGDGFAGVCPFHGDCLEGLVSGPAVLARLGHSLSHTEPDDTGRALVIDAMGQGLATLVLTLSPDRIVIGGGVAKTPGFHAEVTERLKAWLGSYVAVPDGFVVPPALGDRAGVAGGIALAQDLLEHQRRRVEPTHV